jgi:hypothetical protein
MSLNFEYRRDRENPNVFNLFVDGKPTEFHIFGMPMGERTLWLADGGPGNQLAREYPSLEAAFREEKCLLEDIYKTGSIALRGAPAGAGPSGSAWQEYGIVSFLVPLLENICDAIASHREKDRRYQVDINYALPHWFKVTDAGKDSCNIEGAALGCRFKFNSKDGKHNFSAETNDDVEHIFYLFLHQMNTFLIREGLDHTDMVRYFCAISEADSPSVHPDNYVALTGGKTIELKGILENFSGPSLIGNGLAGKFGIIVYAKDSRKGEVFPEYLPVCRKFLEDFEAQYYIPRAMLVCVRKNGEQHVYFYAGKAGFFYNTKDSSYEFLTREYPKLAGALSVVPQLFGHK